MVCVNNLFTPLNKQINSGFVNAIVWFDLLHKCCDVTNACGSPLGEILRVMGFSFLVWNFNSRFTANFYGLKTQFTPELLSRRRRSILTPVCDIWKDKSARVRYVFMWNFIQFVVFVSSVSLFTNEVWLKGVCLQILGLTRKTKQDSFQK